MQALLTPLKSPPAEPEWRAQLEVHLSGKAERTRVAHVEHRGPLYIQRPFYPDDDGAAHLYILHPPGGVVGGDHLRQDIQLQDGARALVTSPAATKLYRSAGRRARLEQRLSVGENCRLEWLPQETIAFPGALAQLTTRVDLSPGAQFIGWEVICLGRPSIAERFASGHLVSRFELWRGDEPLVLDFLRLGPESPDAEASWGLGGVPVVGTMLLTGAPGLAELAAPWVGTCSGKGSLWAQTTVGDALLIRYLGASVPECFATFRSVWRATRPAFSATPSSDPRIWNC